MISDPDLMGTVGAPNGFGLTLGVLGTPATRGPNSGDGFFDSSYTYDPGHTAYSGWLSTSWERRGFELAFDLSFGTGATSGTAMQGGTTKSFTGTTYRFSQTFRIGKRIALRDVSLAAGLGLGWDSWINSNDIDSVGPSEPDASWYVPVWASATIKPACNWGVQVLGEYDVHPTAGDNNGMGFGVGWIYQPNDACSQPPSLRVTPNA
jgi:hypothetical protein